MQLRKPYKTLLYPHLPRLLLREWVLLACLAFPCCMLVFSAIYLYQQKNLDNSALQQLDATLANLQQSGQQESALAQATPHENAPEDLLNALPDKRVLKNLMADMDRLSLEYGITANQVGFRRERKNDKFATSLPAISQYEIINPVQASYPPLRKYIQALLNQYPSLALKQPALQRHAISDPQIDAELHWLVFFKDTP